MFRMVARKFIHAFIIASALNINAEEEKTLQTFFNKVQIESKQKKFAIEIKNALINYNQNIICNEISGKFGLEQQEFQFDSFYLKAVEESTKQFRVIAQKNRIFNDKIELHAEILEAFIDVKDIEKSSVTILKADGKYDKEYEISSLQNIKLTSQDINIEAVCVHSKEVHASAENVYANFEKKSASMEKVDIQAQDMGCNIKKAELENGVYWLNGVDCSFKIDKQSGKFSTQNVQINSDMKGSIPGKAVLEVGSIMLVAKKGKITKDKVILEDVTVLAKDKQIGYAKKSIIDLKNKNFKLIQGENKI
jgi:hypothetical protein